MITANLIGKCLLIGGAGAATGTGIYFIQKSYFSYNKELKELAEKVGLICEGNPTETSGVECTKKEGAEEKLKVKLGASDTFEAKTISGGKITVYTTTSKQDYNQGFKFVIEEGDVSVTTDPAAAAGTAKKLEQFETYEIKEEGGKHNLNRKSEAKAEIKKALGLPAGDTSCDLPTSGEKTCTLDEGKLKAINFEGKSASGLTLETVTDPAASLQMKIATEAEKSTFPHGYKFTLVSNRDITLDTSKVIKKGTNTEFKIKVTPATGGPNVLTLEKAWSVVELGKKVGLKCNETVTNGVGECTLGESINVNNADNTSDTDKKFSGLTKKDETEGKKTVKYEVDQDGHNQGFKFYSEQEISLKDSNNNGDHKKIKAKGDDANNPVTYEILKESNSTTWHLTKKTTAAAA